MDSHENALVGADPAIDAVVIGRNEGARLAACLASLAGQVRRVVYVDSGSTDGSVEAARAAGAEVVALDMGQPFTAARARNAGLARAMAAADPPAFVQFVDGDCMVQPGWVAAAAAFLVAHPQAAVACGRRRERFPDASVYNRLCDREWYTPVGLARACGGDALMRAAAVTAAGGYRDDLIAGEEPELCLRLGRAGWQVWRLDVEMTLHDAAMTRFGQWWRRSRRAGHAFAEGAALHGRGPERHWVAETRRALLWGVALPVAGLVLVPWSLLLWLAYPAQVLRLSRRMGAEAAFFTTLGKFPEAQGVLGYHLARLRRRRAGLIEYK
ncbi:glycosyltransferase [Ruixingdingia sedimenti]|uniref:Glycosyltransferase n=1 Tax=Ruixingdingia sedimenti TaxID=3073604 RepID=A0ABU1F8A2_9RHOB|nr:glycosyltransferase [Xinfangfangia sp. LG-4]MDR5652843.1 glycosyltransferase [Xinfangfangia sp. LG-4]